MNAIETTIETTTETHPALDSLDRRIAAIRLSLSGEWRTRRLERMGEALLRLAGERERLAIAVQEGTYDPDTFDREHDREVAEAAREAGPAGLAIEAVDFDLAKHDATLTITSPKTGEHRTFRVKTVTKGSLAGRRILELLTGPDNESSYTGFAFVNVKDGEPCVSVWGRYRGTIHASYADLVQRAAYWAGRGVTYQIALRCRRCGRKLTRPDSIALGIGPECATKV